MKVNLLSTNLSFTAQTSYSYALMAPPELTFATCKCSLEHYSWDVYTFQSDDCLLILLGDLREKVSRQRSGQRVSLINQLKHGLLPGNS